VLRWGAHRLRRRSTDLTTEQVRVTEQHIDDLACGRR
jgi:hypothetical protein